jgi:DNA-binding MurR/RpiR family transcriptional regulator
MAAHAGDTTAVLADRRTLLSSPAERRVADVLIDMGPRAAPLSAKEIAAEANTSDATVVRAVRSLGYESLRQLRRALTSERDEPDLTQRFEATIAGTAAAHDVLATAAERQHNALDALLRRVPSGAFDAAVGTLVDAEQVWWSGIGPSAHLAGYAAFLCRRLGKMAGVMTHAGTDHADELLALEARQAVVVLAYGRIHPYVRVLLDRAARVGASSVLVTDSAARNLPATVQLDAGRGSPGLFASHGPTIVLVEALVLALAATDPQRSDASLATLNELRGALAGRRLDVDPA